ncbi:MFS-type transporter clz9-like [Colias croceus]|uniref:MFS-type transporter clz9-like n=1 Tax=Colias crocea TaxID=72248 RepID=UPI001E27FAC8|nr:MFS-type transporter clz9-like [Colias croceus]
MPRVYKPKPGGKRYKRYDLATINKAVEEYHTGIDSLKKIAAKYNMHPSVLYRHSKGLLKQQGGQPALSLETENYIIEYINVCAEWGYPMDSLDLRYIIKMYLDKLGVTNTRFKNNMPGPDFVQCFLNRHKDKISQRICQNIKRSRAAVSPETITSFFEELEKSLVDVPVTNIINYDETNLAVDPGQRKILTKRGTKYPERIMNHSKSNVSIMMAGTAAGDLLPPYVVYKAQNLYDTWVSRGPRGAQYNRSVSGWFDGNTFEDWIQTIIIPYFEDKPGRKLLIGDNLSSHISVDMVKLCKEKQIDFVFLPANATHLMQPLDVAFFRPMKIAWREILLKWKKTDGYNEICVPKGCFPQLLKLLMETIQDNAVSNLKSGFKKTGIVPFDPTQVLNRIPNEINDTERHKEAMDQSVINLLNNMQYDTIAVKDIKRKRKINVVAGKSVGEDFLQAEEDRDTENVAGSSTSKKKNCLEQNKSNKIKKLTEKENKPQERKKPETSVKGKGIGKKTKQKESTPMTESFSNIPIFNADELECGGELEIEDVPLSDSLLFDCRSDETLEMGNSCNTQFILDQVNKTECETSNNEIKVPQSQVSDDAALGNKKKTVKILKIIYLY